MEACEHPACDRLLHGRACDFLDVFTGNGLAVDRSTVIPLIRDGLRTEICRARTARGPNTEDDGYAAAQVRAFWAVRGTVL